MTTYTLNAEPPTPEYHPLATPLAKALPMEACPYCSGTGKPERVFGGQLYKFGGYPFDDGSAKRTYCKYCKGYGVEPEVLRAIYESESLEDMTIVEDVTIEAALKEVTGLSWSAWEDKWAEMDEIEAYENQYKDSDDAFDAWRDYCAGA